MAIALILASYLLGAVPTGLILAHAFGLQDPRTFASGNIGAANLARLGGKKLGLFTLLGDAMKGIVPVFLASRIFPDRPDVQALTGLAAVVGHCFPVYLKFKGGKGVATSLGVLLLLAPLETLIAVGVWLAVFFWKRITSLAALVASACIPALVAAQRGVQAEFFAAAGIAAIVFYRHKQNIRELLRGTERSFRRGSTGN